MNNNDVIVRTSPHASMNNNGVMLVRTIIFLVGSLPRRLLRVKGMLRVIEL